MVWERHLSTENYYHHCKNVDCNVHDEEQLREHPYLTSIQNTILPTGSLLEEESRRRTFRLGPVVLEINAIGLTFLKDANPLPSRPLFRDDNHLLAAEPLVMMDEKLLDRPDERGDTWRA
mmetsp:Transcript_41314/g.66484  ORF Transcript_41314/g.66484 Transcript_41314/m.66484 type:complete len:120 (-) Transcript_41314:134-493(-)